MFIKAILTNNKASKERTTLDLKELRTSRLLTEETNFSPEINIYNNKVLIASWKEKMAVIIESNEFADFQRTIFEELWEKLPRQ